MAAVLPTPSPVVLGNARWRDLKEIAAVAARRIAREPEKNMAVTLDDRSICRLEPAETAPNSHTVGCYRGMAIRTVERAIFEDLAWYIEKNVA